MKTDASSHSEFLNEIETSQRDFLDWLAVLQQSAVPLPTILRTRHRRRGAVTGSPAGDRHCRRRHPVAALRRALAQRRCPSRHIESRADVSLLEEEEEEEGAGEEIGEEGRRERGGG
jgi:hypothetical protein